VRDLLGGVTAIARQPVLAAVTAATTVGQVGAGGLAVIAALLAEKHGSPTAVGWLLTSMAIGALAGSVLWTWRPARPRRAPVVVMVSLIASGLPLVALAWSPSTVITAVLFGVSGFFNGPMFGALLTVRNDYAPDHQKSQVFTLSAGARLTASAAGSALAGVAAGLPLTVLSLTAAGTAIVAGAVGQLVLQRRAV
jgi:predicted MFS family arabinose efflux permease